MPDSENPRLPDPGFVGRFQLTVDGKKIGTFTEVTGLEMKMELFTFAEGGNNGAPIRRPGPVTWPNLVFKRGITSGDNTLFDWLAESSGEGLDGKGHKWVARHGSVALLDARFQRIRTWSFRDAYPVRWVGPQFSASGSALATEELEVSHGGFTAG